MSEILKTSHLAPTIISQSKSLRSYFVPILVFGLENNLSLWTSYWSAGFNGPISFPMTAVTLCLLNEKRFQFILPAGRCPVIQI